MFTGIIQEQGKILEIKESSSGKTFKIHATTVLESKKIGDSIAVNGVCVTVTELGEQHFTFDAIQETLETTNLNLLTTESAVNLEPVLTLNGGIDGHLVQGHVDTMGSVIALKHENDRTRLEVKFPAAISKLIAFKGSITINGVSLTISDLMEESFKVDLIPHTLENTNLGKLKAADKVNIEVDLIARYLKRMLDNKEKEASYEYLKERNFI